MDTKEESDKKETDGEEEQRFEKSKNCYYVSNTYYDTALPPAHVNMYEY